VVAVPVDREVRQGAQVCLDRVREGLLVAALGRVVDELRGQARGVQREVQRGVGHVPTLTPQGGADCSHPAHTFPYSPVPCTRVRAAASFQTTSGPPLPLRGGLRGDARGRRIPRGAVRDGGRARARVQGRVRQG